MTSLNNVLRKLIADCTQYCCLCFETIEEKCRVYNILDEVLLETDSVDDVYEILFAVLGEQVINSLSTNTICQKCTESAINSYKFIEVCKNNVMSLSCNMNSLQKYVANPRDNYSCDKSLLFLAMDRVNNKIDEFYDEKRSCRSEAALLERFQELRTKSALLEDIICNSPTLDNRDIEYDPENCDMHEEPTLVVSPKSKVLTQKIKKNSTGQKNIHKQVFQSDQHSNMIDKNIDQNVNRCKDCHKEYRTVKILKQHYSRVHAPKCFKCSICPRSFGSQFLLNRHIKASHCIAVCSYCGKIYYNTYSLKHHEKTHMAHLVCKTCGKAYKGQQAFNNHVEQKLCEQIKKTNSGAKFTCKYCEKKYTQKSALNVHIRLEHEEGKAVICNWCGKKLSCESRLKEHIVKHTKHKNFQCETCGEKLVTKTSLMYHMRIHTGEKPYKCEHCDLKFLSASRRLEHESRNHAGPDLECDICQSKFKGPAYLKRHRKRHFNIKSKLYYLRKKT